MKNIQKTDFGIIRKYFPDRGFGFVDSVFISGKHQSTFFHIKAIKRSNPSLANEIESLFSRSIGASETQSQPANNRLETSNNTLQRPVRFWFNYQNTLKGNQLIAVLEAKSVQKTIIDEKNPIPSKVDDIWMNIHSPIPEWLQEVTVASLGDARAIELAKAREELEKNQQKIEEMRQIERKTAQTLLEKIEEMRQIERKTAQTLLETERQKSLEESKLQMKIEEDEFDQLVADVRSRGFRFSNQLSQYIVENRLGYQYKNISGVLQMEENGESWKFDGGFPTHIYARLCNELNLRNQGSAARPCGFTPYKKLLK